MQIFSGLLEVTLIASLAALGCSLIGPVLLLRKRVLLGDAVSHSLLAGIAVAYLVHPVLGSPWLRVGAVLSGGLAAWIASVLTKQLRGRADAALGLVFPAFFSLGALILAMVAANTHLDVDQVLSGNLETAWLERTTFWGLDVGPTAAWNMGMLVLILVLTGTILRRDLILHMFDPQQGILLARPMFAVELAVILGANLVIVLAFDSMGPILVVALLAAPGVCAWLLCNRLPGFFLVAILAGQIAVIAGVGLAGGLDLNLAGAIGLAAVSLAGLAFVFAPRTGILNRFATAGNSREKFVANLLLVHARFHEAKGDQEIENHLSSLPGHLKLKPWEIESAATRLIRDGLAQWDGEILKTTLAGRELAGKVLGGIEQTDKGI